MAKGFQSKGRKKCTEGMERKRKKIKSDPAVGTIFRGANPVGNFKGGLAGTANTLIIRPKSSFHQRPTVQGGRVVLGRKPWKPIKG